MTDVRRPEGTPVTLPSRPSSAPRPGGRRRVAGERVRGRRPESVPVQDVPELGPELAVPEPDATELAPDAPSETLETASAPRHVVPTWVPAALGVLLVAVVVAVSLLAAAARRADAVDAAQGEAVRAARTAATRLLSYDYRRLDADFAAGRALTAPPFSEQYAQTTAQAVRKVATDTKATVVAEVAAVGVQRAAPGEVTVLLFVNQTTTSNRLQRPQVDQNRVEMTLVRRGDRWLVSRVRGL